LENYALAPQVSLRKSSSRCAPGARWSTRSSTGWSFTA